VSGYGAWSLDRVLRSVLGDPAAWATITGPLSPPQRAAFIRALRTIAEAAEDWLAVEATAAGGNAATAVGPVAAGSTHDEIDTAEAARLLGLGERRVRDLAAAGCLGARRVGAAWRFPRGSVVAHAAERRRAG
jgi:excisionase family DNA binding protein